MADLWPWVVLAGLGAFHGLSPASGWMLAAACGMRAGDVRQAWRALLPIGIGHAASIAAVAWAFAQGLSMNRTRLHAVAGALLVGAASLRLLRGSGRRTAVDKPTGHGGVLLWSFLMTTTQGAALMLVP